MSESPPTPEAPRTATRLVLAALATVGLGARRAAPYLLIAAVATFPLVLTPLSRLIGHEDVDVWNHAWGAWWFHLSFAHATLPWRTTLLAGPRGGVLWFIDPIGALMGAPLTSLLGVVGAYNTAIFAQVALAAFAGRRLASAFGASPQASWLGAVAVAASPAVLSEVHNGVSEAVGVAWPVFALAAARRALEPGSGLRAWALVGLWIGVTAFGTWYYAFGVATIVAVWAAVPADGEGLAAWRAALPGRLRGLAVAAAVSLCLIGPLFAAIDASITAPDAIVRRGEATAAELELLLRHNAVDPRAFVLPGGFQSVDLAAQGEAFEHSSYLGLVALALALAASRPRALAAAIPVLVLSLGPYLYVAGDWVPLEGGARLGLPFHLMLAVLPDTAVTHAQRVGVPGLALVAALAAVGAARLPLRALPLVGLALVGDLLWASPWPLARAPALDTAAHRAIAATGGREMVIDLPGEVGATMATSRYLIYQVYSGHSIPYRPDARSGTSTLLGSKLFTALALPSAHREEPWVRAARLETGPPDTRSLGADVRWVVLHRELERGAQGVAEIEARLTSLFGPPAQIGSHPVWDLRASPPHASAPVGAPAPSPPAP